MRQLTLALALTILVGATIGSLSPVDAYQYKSGYINENITWTKDEGPYRLTGPVYVNIDVTLTIEPGTIIDFYSYNIYVYGTLNCQGTSDTKLSYTPQPTTHRVPSISIRAQVGMKPPTQAA